MTASLILWKIICVDKARKYVQRKIQDDSGSNVITLDREELGIYDKELMLDTSQLTEKQQIMVEIALRRKELMNDDSFFIPLRDLFHKYSDNEIGNFEKFTSICIPQYHEDENDIPLSDIEFVQIISGMEHLIQLHDGKYIQDCVFPNDGKDTNIPELTEIKGNDFEFTDNDIWCLNTFVYDSFRLIQSPLFRAPTPYKLAIENKMAKFSQEITEEQFVASAIEFRKLYMENEPCNFLKTIKKMTDRRHVHHPIYKDFNQFRDEYLYYLGKIASIQTLQPVLQMTNIPFDKLSDVVTGKNIINSLLYTGLIHQGEDKDRDIRSALEKELISSHVIDFLAWSLISRVSHIFHNSAVFIYNILRYLNKLKIAIPQAGISDAERRFNTYVLQKSYKLSEIIWKENGRSPDGCLQFHEEAKTQIESIFKGLFSWTKEYRFTFSKMNEHSSMCNADNF